VTIDAVVNAGAECDSIAKAGLAQFTANLLTEGAAEFDGAALAERIELLGSAMTSAADWDYALLSLTVRNSRFAEALSVIGDVLLKPHLPEREFERLRSERLAELLQMRTEPRSLADEMFSALVYSGDSRYSRPLGGSEKSVRSVALADVAEFHATRYAPRLTTILVVGDVSVAAALGEVEKVFGGWRGRETQRDNVVSSRRVLSQRTHLVSKDGAPQSEIRVGLPGPSRATPDYFDIVVMNALLGGLFSSRINLNLRERHGYTYGAFSQFDWRHGAGPFVVSTAVRSDVTVAALREIMLELQRIREEPVSESELSLALNYLSGVFPIRFETTVAIATALSSLVTYSLPENYFDSYRNEICAVTPERILRAAQRYLSTDSMSVVVVGDPAVVRAPLEEYSDGALGVYGSEAGVLE
jgi:zinc protease